MSVRTRLNRVERKCREEAELPRFVDSTDEDWLEWFMALDELDAMSHEPDFPVAVAAYRQAIEEATKQDDPPFSPPDDYEPDTPRSLRINWWRGLRFCEVGKAWDWLSEMVLRTYDGVPPVSEAQFSELTNWFKDNSSRLHEIESHSFPIVIDGEELPSLTNIYYRLTCNGPRREGAGKVAQHVRRLQAAFGEE